MQRKSNSLSNRRLPGSSRDISTSGGGPSSSSRNKRELNKSSSLNLLNHHNIALCSSTNEVFVTTLNCYFSDYKVSFDKMCARVPTKLTTKQRWDMALNQIRRCIFARQSDMCIVGKGNTLENYLNKLNAFADSLVALIPKPLQSIARMPSAQSSSRMPSASSSSRMPSAQSSSRMPSAQSSSRIPSAQSSSRMPSVQSSSKLGRSGRLNPLPIDQLFPGRGQQQGGSKPEYLHVSYLENNTLVLYHVGLIYALIKLYMILQKLQEMTMNDPNFDIRELQICYTTYTDKDYNRNKNGKHLFTDVINRISTSKPTDTDVNRQLFLISKRVNHIYSGHHVFSVYYSGTKLVDTYNNVFTSIVYDQVNQKPTGSGNNPVATANNFDVRIWNMCLQKNTKNEKKTEEPSHQMMHYNGSNAYLFRCDEYFGDSIHRQIKELREYKYSSNETSRRFRTVCMLTTPILPSSGNYTDKCCKNDVNLVYQYIDLFSDETKKRLYDYIYRNENGEMSNLGIYYILVNIYGQSNNRERLLILSNKANSSNGNKTTLANLLLDRQIELRRTNLKALFPVTSNSKKSLPNFTKETLQKIQSKPYGL